MTNSALEKLLTDHASAQREGERLVLGAIKASVFVRIGNESMPIDRVVAVELSDDLCTIHCARGEIYAVATADIAAVRFQPTKPAAGLIEAR